MTTITPSTRSVTTLDDLPRPKNSLAAWAKLFFAPETARQHLATLGERFVLDVPLLPTMFWTSSPDDVRAVFQDKTRALSLGTGLRRLAPHELVFGERIMTWWASDDHTVVRRKVAPAFMGKALLRAFGESTPQLMPGPSPGTMSLRLKVTGCSSWA